MATYIGAPKVLLRRLREIMAQQSDPQAILDQIVVQIAAIMVAEVSSIYVCRSDRSLELFATEGLNPTAVHNTHLAPDEGLVGLVAVQAAPLALTDARNHPSFSYHPETGEDPYNAFLGVPILRGGHTLGVLTLQNQAKRQYTEEELEAMQTTAMVLAELLTSIELSTDNDQRAEKQSRANTFHGVTLSEGIALGHVVLHQPRIVFDRALAEDADREKERIISSVSTLRRSIDDMFQRGDVARAGEHRDVLEAYRMFAHDRGWVERMVEAAATGLTAEAAVEHVQNETRARILQTDDPFFRERLHDFDDLSVRLLRILTGKTLTAAEEDLPNDTILVARHMGAAELLDYDRKKLRGLVLEEGGPQSHVAIVARALGIAAVGQAIDVVSSVEAGDDAVVDAESGDVHIRPTQDVITAYSDKVRFHARRQQQYAQLRDRPARTLDGEDIKMNINAGLMVDLPHLFQSGADGIGLFRTELQFMVSATFPKLKQQTATYRAIVETAGDKPVVFRTLDIGGDKVLPYLRHAQEENPALGWRAIRMALDRPAIFRTQIRALLHASQGRELRVMLPMTADVWEVDKAKELIKKEQSLMLRFGYEPPTTILIGAMLEVPSLLWQLDALLPKLDFASIGSNDLLQFLFAVDRSNIRVSNRFDPLSPAMLRALDRIIKAGQKHNVPIALCGEMAGRPIEAMALIGLGLRQISMAPASIGPVKSMILSLNAKLLSDRLHSLLEHKNTSLRPDLEAFAKEQQIPL